MTLENEPSTQTSNPVAKKPRRDPIAWHFDWIPGILTKPRATFQKIIAQEKPVWLTPLLLISLLVLISAAVAVPVRTQLTQSEIGELPEGFQYWTDEDQAKFFQSQENKLGLMFMFVFPLLKGIAGYWALWFFFTSIWHLALTLTGARVPRVKASNFVAWAMLPFTVRLLVQVINTLATKSLGAAPGLSSLLPADAAGFMTFLRAVLAAIDAYWVWFTVLILLAAAPLSKLKKSKALAATLGTVFLVLILSAIPSLLGAWLSAVTSNASF